MGSDDHPDKTSNSWESPRLDLKKLSDLTIIRPSHVVLTWGAGNGNRQNKAEISAFGEFAFSYIATYRKLRKLDGGEFHLKDITEINITATPFPKFEVAIFVFGRVDAMHLTGGIGLSASEVM